MKYVLSILLILFLVGCNTPPKPSKVTTNIEQPPHHSDPSTVDLILNGLNGIDKKAEEKGVIFLQLGVIPGKIYGSPLQDPKWYIDLHKDSKPVLNQDELAFTLSHYSGQLNESKFSEGLTITPKDTQIVRASTFGADYKQQLLLSGSMRNKHGDFVVLLYADRACKITGDIDFGEEGVYKHAIDIPRAGLYRLIIKDDKSPLKIIKAIQSTEPLTVQLE